MLALCMQNQILGMLFFSTTLHNFFSVAALAKTKSQKKAFNLYFFPPLCNFFFFRFGIVHYHERRKIKSLLMRATVSIKCAESGHD